MAQTLALIILLSVQGVLCDCGDSSCPGLAVPRLGGLHLDTSKLSSSIADDPSLVQAPFESDETSLLQASISVHQSLVAVESPPDEVGELPARADAFLRRIWAKCATYNNVEQTCEVATETCPEDDKGTHEEFLYKMYGTNANPPEPPSTPTPLVESLAAITETLISGMVAGGRLSNFRIQGWKEGTQDNQCPENDIKLFKSFMSPPKTTAGIVRENSEEPAGIVTSIDHPWLEVNEEKIRKFVAEHQHDPAWARAFLLLQKGFFYFKPQDGAETTVDRVYVHFEDLQKAAACAQILVGSFGDSRSTGLQDATTLENIKTSFSGFKIVGNENYGRYDTMVLYLTRLPDDKKKWLNQFILSSCDGFAEGVPGMMSVPIAGKSIGWATEPPKSNKYGQRGLSFGSFYAALINEALKKALAMLETPQSKPICDYTIFRDQVRMDMVANKIKPDHPEDVTKAVVSQ